VWIAIVSIIGTLASLVGVYAIVDNRRNRRVKALAYEHTGAIPLATANRHEQDYELAVVYRPPGGQAEERIDAAYVTYLRFANFGKEPIRAADIAPANPLRVEVSGIRVLDISLSNTCRDVSQVKVDNPDLGDHGANARITFDFLDYEDGGMVRILTDGWGEEATVKLTGDIIGMRRGITRTDAQRSHKEIWGKVGVGAFVASELGAFAGAAFLFRSADGSWDRIWLLGLPLAAFLAPLFATILISVTVWPTSTKPKRYPKALSLPHWLPPFPRSPGYGPAYMWPPMIDVSDDLQLRGEGEVPSTMTKEAGS
jgi:hypothetical protein